MGNHNSGRRASRTLTMLRGNPGKRHRPVELESPAGAVVKPAGLSAGAAVVWDELAPVCLQMRTLSVADVRPFRMLCELQATLDEAATWKGTPRRAEAIQVEKQFATLIRAYYGLFGLDPVSRARIAVPAAAAPVSKWAGALP